MDIKQLMLEYFEKPDINDKIRQYAEDNNLRYEDLSDDQLMDILDQLQILQPLLESLDSKNINNQLRIQKDNLQDLSISTGLKKLKILVQNGRNFKSWKYNDKGQKFFFSISAFGQKFRTSTFNISQSFTVGQQFIFQIQNRQLKPENDHLIQLAVVIQTKQATRRLQSIKLVQWRYVLAHGHVAFDIFLAPYYHEGLGQVPSLGILSVKLHLTPLSKLNMVQPATIERQILLQTKNRQKYNKQFYNYANLFWQQFKLIHKSFQSRRIKIYGDSDDKIFIPLCRFVCPLYNIRGIDSPQHALRFCSLIPFQEQKINKKVCHKRFHSMVAGMQGTIDDHCHLLCSLLLGFGLKAYVCVGYSYKGEHTWVLTQDQKNSSIIFWQSTKGLKYDFYSTKLYQFYKSIHLVYNHNEFYANIQLDDSIQGTKYKFKDSSLWKSIQTSFLDNIPLYNKMIALSTPTFDIIKIQKNIEDAICEKIEQFRRLSKLPFKRDFILSSILSTSLANYQIERITGNTFCEDQFQNAIRNYIPPKHTFKAFPIQLTTLDPQIIIETLKNQPKCRQILLSSGDSVEYGIRAKLVVYPDNIFALWLTVGVRFFKLM